MKKILLFSLFCFVYNMANAVTYYWVGLSSAGVWSDAANWSLTSGGAGNAGVPKFSSDVAKLDKTAVINVSTTVSIASISVSANVGLSPSTGVIMSANSVSVDAGFTFTLNAVGGTGTTLTVGTISVSGTLDLSVNGSLSDLSVTGSLFGGTIKRTDASGRSKIRFIGSSAQSISANLDPSSNIDVIVNNGSAGLSLSSNLYIPGSLTLAGSKLTVGTYSLVIKNLITGNYVLGNYVILNNPAGSITLENVRDDRLPSTFNGKIFHIGISATSADPIYIANDQGADVGASFTVKLANRVPTGAINPSKVFRREWDISSSSTAAFIEFEPHSSAEPSAGFIPTPPVIGHFTGGKWTEKANAPDPAISYGLSYRARFTSFSPFGVGQASGFLPVELVSFNAQQKNNTNLLSWQTASEKGNSHFDIERSATGQEDWVKIGTVKGAGTSQTIQNYRFDDNTPLTLSYYRLKQVNTDESFEYSKVISVTRKGEKFKLNTLSPNPTKDNVTIQFESDKKEAIHVSVMDMTGRIVLSQNAVSTEGPNVLNLNMSSLSNGIYFMSLKNSETVIVEKVVKGE
jgi:hypothetical protein